MHKHYHQLVAMQLHQNNYGLPQDFPLQLLHLFRCRGRLQGYNLQGLRRPPLQHLLPCRCRQHGPALEEAEAVAGWEVSEGVLVSQMEMWRRRRVTLLRPPAAGYPLNKTASLTKLLASLQAAQPHPRLESLRFPLESLGFPLSVRSAVLAGVLAVVAAVAGAAAPGKSQLEEQMLEISSSSNPPVWGLLRRRGMSGRPAVCSSCSREMHRDRSLGHAEKNKKKRTM